VDGGSDLRLRHRDFQIRVDRIGPGSRRLDRSDATFVVRPGLADQRCLSLEAVNYPGRFVRHQDFRLVLHPRATTSLYASDATFCARPTGDGARFVLRSVNFPDRFLTVRDSAVRLGPVPPGTALVLRSAPGL
jgi:hypothetical protein